MGPPVLSLVSTSALGYLNEMTGSRGLLVQHLGSACEVCGQQVILSTFFIGP